MKTIFFLISFVFCFSCFSQDCRNYYYLQNNKTIEVTMYDKKGGTSGKLVYVISDVKTLGGTTAANVNSEVLDNKGKMVAKSTSTIKCSGGVMMVDMKMMIPMTQQEQFKLADAKAENAYIEYPSKLTVGQQLKDGSFAMDIENNGVMQSMAVAVNDRKVEAKESVTTTAGTWDCYKISYKSKLSIKTMGINIPINMDGTEWYAPGFGIVKTESNNGGTAITAIK